MSIETVETAHDDATDLAKKYAKRTIDFKGRPYLTVAQRLLWLLEAHPDASIEAKVLQFPEGQVKPAICWARVSVGGGRQYAESVATHYATNNVADAVANADTSAVGRACARLGIGTEWALQDFEEGRNADGSVAIVDAPAQVQRQAAPVRPRPQAGGVPQSAQRVPQAPPRAANESGERMATEPQKRKLAAMLAKEGVQHQATYHGGENYITFTQVRHAIDELASREGAGYQGSGELPDWKILSGQIVLDEWDEEPS